MKLDRIIIKKGFALSHPSPKKLAACRAWYAEHDFLDRDIVVNRRGVLIDGYIGYLVLLENGVTDVDVVIVPPDENRLRTYVFAVHPSDPRAAEYVWRITDSTKAPGCLAIGKRVLVYTKNGHRIARVTRVEQLGVPPVDGAIKKVIKCFED